MPGDAELNKLARILEFWRIQFLADQYLLQRTGLQNRARKALDELNDAVSAIVRFDKERYDADVAGGAPMAALRWLSDRLVESNSLRAHVARIGDLPGLAYSPAKWGFAKWHRLATVLPVDFAEVMKPQNSKFKGGISRGGPVVRFISAVVPMVTGEHPTAASVRRLLQRAKSPKSDIAR
jgi:hypothetical protein